MSENRLRCPFGTNPSNDSAATLHAYEAGGDRLLRTSHPATSSLDQLVTSWTHHPGGALATVSRDHGGAEVPGHPAHDEAGRPLLVERPDGAGPSSRCPRGSSQAPRRRGADHRRR